jgi:hypothetical protein
MSDKSHACTRTMRRILNYSLRLALLAACLAFVAAPRAAWAQKEGGAGIAAAQAATEPSWVFPYFVMILSTGLGLYLLGKPSRRKNLDVQRDGPD